VISVPHNLQMCMQCFTNTKRLSMKMPAQQVHCNHVIYGSCDLALLFLLYELHISRHQNSRWHYKGIGLLFSSGNALVKMLGCATRIKLICLIFIWVRNY